MSTIGPTYPAHIIVSQAEVRLVADETSSANAAKIKSDQNEIEAAQEIEAAEAKADSVNFVTWRHRNGPGTGDAPRPLVSELPAGVAKGDKPDQQKFLHSDMS
jgi:hypothetical protein